MRTINGIFVGCFVSLISMGCSLQKLDPINEGNAGKDAGKSTGGSAGDSAAGRSSRGGTTSNGGSSTSTGGTTSSSSTTGGPTSEGGSSSIGGSATSGGTTSNGGSSNSTVGGTSSIGGTSVISGGTSSIGGSKATGGTTSSVVGGSAATGGTTAAGGTSAVGLAITTPTLPTGKTYVTYSGTVTASGATSYSWSISSGSLPSGLTLQNTTSATVTIAGTPTEAGLYPVKLAVTDGVRATTIDVQVAVTHKVAFLSDRITSGVKELFLVEVGAETVADPVRLSTPLTSAGIASFAWSPDGAKIAYLVGSELRIAEVSSPGTATSLGSGVVNYSWLNLGQSLAFSATSGAVTVVDVSSAAPWTPRAVGLPAIAATRSFDSLSLLPSPHNRDFAVSRVTTAAGVAMDPNWENFQVTWGTGATVTVRAISTEMGFSSPFQFSFDGSILRTSSSSGCHFWQLSESATPLEILQLSPFFNGLPSWSPVTNSVLTTNVPNGADPPNLTLRRASSTGIWTNTVLSNPVCPPVVGPWSPDGKSGLFACGADLRGIASVAVATLGSDKTLLPADFATNGFTSINAYGWSPDSNWVALRADRFTSNVDDLYLVKFNSSSTAVRPYGAIAAPGVTTWQFAPNSRYVAYVGILGTATLPGLYVSQLPSTGTPGNAAQITAASSPSVQTDIGWLAGSRVLLYRANDAGGAQLHATPLSSAAVAGNAISLTGAYGTGVSVYQPAPTR